MQRAPIDPKELKMAVVVEIGTVRNATVFVEIETGGETLDREEASRRARRALIDVVSGPAAPPLTGFRGPAADPAALFWSWALPQAGR